MKSNKKVIAVWLECEIEIAPANYDETFPKEGLESIGLIKAKSTRLQTTEGKDLELRKTGGRTIDAVKTEGGFELATVIAEPTKLYQYLKLTKDDYDSTGRMKIKTHLARGKYAVRLLPKRIGGMGIEAPVTQVFFKPTGSETEGGSALVCFRFLHSKANYWYERVMKKWENQEAMMESCYGLGIWIPGNIWGGKVQWQESEITELTATL